ncbi:hypothetical protein BKA70DRAFT_1376547 [Coprinopsis sp. MPI-PUGE-AT-0042]|nr:hypothetical protein BKA70DRAFT_1376547 [Coprinopsis sp. MPI-PUGE-AT-0042]
MRTADKTIRKLNGETGQECSWVLQEKCPACFAGKTFGISTDAGRGDIHVSLDGNFAHRHLRRTVDEVKQYHVPPYYVGKEFVDNIGEAMAAAKAKPAKARTPKVPDEAVDGCEDGHIAGKGTNVKTSTQIYDDTGMMALCCRHDIPILQKYAVALLAKLFDLLPSEATVIAFYDVGCVLDQSLQTYDYLPGSITSRLSFVTSAMHAYAHQWACQLKYNPRMRPFIGLSDGEGTERIWSCLRKIIPLARVSGRSHRLWLINNLLASVGEEMRDSLGEWLKQRSNAIANFRRAAQAELAECSTPIQELCTLWDDQKKSQSSIRSLHASKVKKDLDAILHLQADLNVIDNRVEAIASGIAKDYPSGHRDLILSTLKACQDALNEKIEALFGNLNVGDSYPELKGMDYEFVKTLLVMRDLKINIRKRAIANFFEYERLNQAVGGRNLPLGTNAHQLTRKAISKRQPALQGAVRRFNTLRLKLQELHKPEWKIPLPAILPTNLGELRDNSDLMEDVWLSLSPVQIPKWLEDPGVRKGIRAMLKLDHCQEELIRLGREADNMCRWYGRELGRVEVALASAFGNRFKPQLGAYRQKLHLLSSRWASSFAVPKASIPAWWLGPKDPTSAVTTTVTTLVLDHDREDSLPPWAQESAVDEGHLCSGLDSAGKIFQCRYRLMLALIWVFSLLSASLLLSIRRSVRAGFVEFCPRSLDILESPSARLNDVCINSGGALLQHLFSSPASESECSARSCALFSTFDLPASKGGCSISHLFTKTQHTLYWERLLWILPIHDSKNEGHWVVCTIYPLTSQIIVFDSLARRSYWEAELPHVLAFVERLVLAANANGHHLPVITETCWQVYSVATQRVQSSPTSCGVWVLAQIAAVLWGCHVTGLNEDQLSALRASVYRLIHNLPVLASSQ